MGRTGELVITTPIGVDIKSMQQAKATVSTLARSLSKVAILLPFSAALTCTTGSPTDSLCATRRR